MRKFLHATVVVVALMVASTANAPTAQAGVDNCTYAAQQWCKGVTDQNGDYYYPGGPGWVVCVEDAKQYIAECEPRPSTGATGSWCYRGAWYGWAAC